MSSHASETSSRHVLVITSVFPRWEGDATPPFVQNQCELMARKGWRVTVLAPHARGAALKEIVKGVTVYRHRYMFPEALQCLCYDGGILVNFRARPLTKMLLPFFYLSQVMGSAWLCFRLKPELIHSHSLLPQGLTGCLLKRLFGCPHVTTSHGNDVFGLKQTGLMGRLKQTVIRSADAITANSNATQKALIELGATLETVSLIPAFANETAVDSELVNRLKVDSGTAKRLLFVGRLIEEKGVDTLLRALPAVLECQPDLQCYIVGDGARSKEIKALVAKLSIQESVHFVGWRPREEIPSWMASADVLVVPSRQVGTWQEAQGLVVVEAMLVATPVIASKIGGIPDMIEDGVTGRLVTPSDHEALAHTILDLLTDREQAECLSVAGRKKAKALYSADAVGALLDALYTSVLEAKEMK